jgi:hypothetical protein
MPEKTKVASEGALISYFPSASVDVPTRVFFTTILTPGSDALSVEDVTVPFMVMFWAKAASPESRDAMSRTLLLPRDDFRDKFWCISGWLIKRVGLEYLLYKIYRQNKVEIIEEANSMVY